MFNDLVTSVNTALAGKGDKRQVVVNTRNGYYAVEYLNGGVSGVVETNMKGPEVFKMLRGMLFVLNG
jgi:hypothetical protein